MNKFSIILPVRNGGEYVKTCVNSILSQTNQDFNLIILDNCSTDGTREWITSLQSEKIIIYPSDKSLSIEENWGRITAVSKNEFITLIGHDDILHPDFLENINRLIDQYPHAGLYHTHFNFIDATSNIIRYCKPMPNFISAADLLRGFLTYSIDSMGTGYVMRSKDYDELGGIPVKYPSLLFADFELWLSLAKKDGMAVSSSTCFAFRVHKGTTGSAADYKMQEALKLYVDFLALQKQNDPATANIINEFGSEFLLNNCQSLAHRLLRTSIDKRNGVTVGRLIRETGLLAQKLGVENDYKPLTNLSISIANTIDKSSVLRSAFLFFKKIYSKPVL